MDRRRWQPELSALEWSLVVLVVASTFLFVHENTAQSASRLALTAALAEQGTVVIDDYEHTIGADYAVRDGYTYSDKAPGQPVPSVPLWWAYRAVGGDPGTSLQVEGHLGLWWLVLWWSVLPACALAVLMFRLAARTADGESTRIGALTALSLAFGTLLLPFSTLLFGHVAAAALVTGSFLVLRDRQPSVMLVGLAGAAAGAGVAVEYTVGLVAVILTVACLVRHRNKTAVFVVGGALATIPMAVYHWIAFGSPLSHAYEYSVFDFHHDTIGGIGRPDAGTLMAVVFGERGLLTLTPVVAVAIAGFIAGRRRLASVDLAVPAAVLFGYLVFASGWIDATGGWSPGPRHLIPALPFLAAGTGQAWQRWPRVTGATTVISALAMVVATIGGPLVPIDVDPAMRLWLENIGQLDVARTVLYPVIGDFGLVLVAAGVGLAAWRFRQHLPEGAVDAEVSGSPPSPVGGP